MKKLTCLKFNLNKQTKKWKVTSCDPYWLTCIDYLQCVGPFTFSHLINTLQSKNCGFNLILQKKKYRFMDTEWLVWQHTKNSSVGQWTEAVCPSSALLPTWCSFSTDFQELSPNRTFPVNLGKEQLKKITVILTKQTRQRQISCNIAYMWNLTNELIYKTEIDPET